MRIVELNRGEFFRLWSRFIGKPGTSEYEGEEGKEFFRTALMDSVLLLEFPFGLVRVTNYSPGKSVSIHGLFDSKEVFREVEQLRSAGLFLMRTYNVGYVRVVVPDKSRALKRLIEKVGFKKVKTLPEGLFDGRMYVDGEEYRAYRRNLL